MKFPPFKESGAQIVQKRLEASASYFSGLRMFAKKQTKNRSKTTRLLSKAHVVTCKHLLKNFVMKLNFN